MSTTLSDAESLRKILENFRNPERLDTHPWAARPFVREAVNRNASLRDERPGRQLIAALGELFSTTKPSTPPRRGKRLDTRWAEFGLLASLYFAPVQFGAPVPCSLRDAWGRIDPSILLYVNGHGPEHGALDAYRLVSDEPEVAPISTLSDWHRKGIQRLAEAVGRHEAYLGNASAGALSDPNAEAETTMTRSRKQLRPWTKGLLGLLLVLLILIGLGGYKTWKVYQRAQPLRTDLSQLKELAGASPSLSLAPEAGMLLARTRQDLDGFREEVEPFLWLFPSLRWVPVYGGDLAASAELLDLADRLMDSAGQAFVASRPLIAALDRDRSLDPSQLASLLAKAEPQFNQARQSLGQARELRTNLQLDRLSSRTRSLIEDHIDPLLPLLDDGLAAATALPHMLGAADEGPKTYMLLVQNEDELRPTGGFITAVGTLVVQNGEVLSLAFVDSGELENWDRPYPMAPWQLEEYMNSPVLILRDSNWFPDFPTSALYAESLYAYQYAHSVDGVIAFDQHMLVLILEALGPVPVEGAADPIDAQNIISYMRAAKSPPTGEAAPVGWTRKGFMDEIANALLVKMFEGQGIAWENLGSVLLEGLEQQHVLLQLDDPTIAPLIARRGWDGALRYEDGDFLMVVDTNVGFNKTNAVVETSLSYDVDLTDIGRPLGTLTITHRNNAATVACEHWEKQRVEGQEQYPIDDCYWNYMRVYAPEGVELLDATPQSVPDPWMILGRGVQGSVDVLDEELDGLQGFGSLMVVPGNESHLSSFRFRLPEHVLSMDGDRATYHLKVNKQPGTRAIPIIVRIHLPNSATLESVAPAAAIDGNHLYLETNLSTDLDLDVIFRPR